MNKNYPFAGQIAWIVNSNIAVEFVGNVGRDVLLSASVINTATAAQRTTAKKVNAHLLKNAMYIEGY